MTTHDFVAIGLGPCNLGLACLTEQIPGLDGLFLERSPDFSWHPGLLLETSTLQTPFLADLVTLADPTSPFSFLNYLKQSGRIYPFYIRESFYPLRTEYDAYCRWAVRGLSGVRFDEEVERVDHDEHDDVHVVTTVTGAGTRHTHRGRHLVLGTGTTPHLPAPCRALGEDLHSSRYLDSRDDLQSCRTITVVGSGQSAAEIFLDLLQDADRCGYDLTWVTRSPRFFPLEYTKLTLEMTSPDYTGYFHRLPADVRDRLVADQASLYKGVDASLLNEIFDLLYVKSSGRRCPARLLTNTAVSRARRDERTGEYVLRLRQQEEGIDHDLRTEGLVLATGYRHEVPDFLAPITDRLAWDQQGRYDVRRDYRVDRVGPAVFVQNGELHTHGFVAPDLGMTAYRNSWIIRSMTGREVYPIEETVAHQEFGAPVDRSTAGQAR